MKTIDRLEAALAYAERGWQVLPLKPKSKDPHFDLVKGAYKGASDDVNLINFWFKMDAKANIGIACQPSGLIVVDIDYRNGGEMMPEFNETYTVQTGDGLHLYYKANNLYEYRGSIEKGIDVKYKGYVAAAPSIHPSNKIYTVINEIEPQEMSFDLLEKIIK